MCRCPSAWSGKLCNIASNPCDPNPCQYGGICSPKGASVQCSCPPGRTGVFCETASTQDLCASNPCLNGGVCASQDGQFWCTCPKGRMGRLCEEVDSCALQPCRNGGVCQVTATGFQCTCQPGWIGTLCSVVSWACSSNPCQHSSLCVAQESGGFKCYCSDGWTGPVCDQPVNPCASNPCLNGGYCAPRISTFQCTCAEGWGGHLCGEEVDPCNANPCQNAGMCISKPGGYQCLCPNGWTGPTCTTVLDPCAINPCENGGQCAKVGMAFYCLCPAGWIGDFCRTADPGQPTIPDQGQPTTPCQYTAWSGWTPCDRTCGGGQRMRSRQTFPPSCLETSEPTQDVLPCNTQRCSDQDVFAAFQASGLPTQTPTITPGAEAFSDGCLYSEWGGWNACSAPCGGSQSRSRFILFYTAACDTRPQLTREVVACASCVEQAPLDCATNVLQGSSFLSGGGWSSLCSDNCALQTTDTAATLSFSAGSPAAPQVVLVHDVVLTAGVKYTLRFAASSTCSGLVLVKVGSFTATYVASSWTAPPDSFPLTYTWVQPEGCPPDAGCMLQVILGGPGCSYQLAHMSLCH